MNRRISYVVDETWHHSAPLSCSCTVCKIPFKVGDEIINPSDKARNYQHKACYEKRGR